MSMVATKVTYLAVRYASALASADMRSGVSNFPSANVCTATTNMRTKVFTATSTEMFTATAMAAPTALGHRRLSAQIYQRAERNGHRKYFVKSDCHRRTPRGKKTCARALSSIKQTFRIALAMSALGQKRTYAVQKRHIRFIPRSGLPTLLPTARQDP
jgi:hypothetical protein